MDNAGQSEGGGGLAFRNVKFQYLVDFRLDMPSFEVKITDFLRCRHICNLQLFPAGGIFGIIRPIVLGRSNVVAIELTVSVEQLQRSFVSARYKLGAATNDAPFVEAVHDRYLHFVEQIGINQFTDDYIDIGW